MNLLAFVNKQMLTLDYHNYLEKRVNLVAASEFDGSKDDPPTLIHGQSGEKVVALVNGKPATVVDKRTGQPLTHVNWCQDEPVLCRYVTKQIPEICSTLTKCVKLH